MKDSIITKLESLKERYEELEALLGDASVISDQDKFRAYSKEYAQLEEVVKCFNRWTQLNRNVEEAEMLLDDAEMKEMAQMEIEASNAEIEETEQQLQILLLPKDPNDEYNCYLKVSGEGVYGQLKFESGGHRVQRVPKTESQGRIHTSACTVAVMPELPESEMPEINPADLRIDTYRSSGAGGQHVNTTDSAVRITHIPTGIVVECQDERSQHKNKAKAMSVLASRIVQAEQERQAAEQTDMRRNLLGSGDRSDKIRTYNYPQGRVTDHRINLTIYRLDEVMNGKIDELIQPIITEYQADQLAALSEQN